VPGAAAYPDKRAAPRLPASRKEVEGNASGNQQDSEQDPKNQAFEHAVFSLAKKIFGSIF
jgi:hypothetical protein